MHLSNPRTPIPPGKRRAFDARLAPYSGEFDGKQGETLDERRNAGQWAQAAT